MTKIDKFKEELKDSIKEKTEERLKLISSVEELTTQITNLLEKYYVIDERMVAIKCPTCKGTGYMENKGNKQLCPSCGGPDKPYIWVEKYESGK